MNLVVFSHLEPIVLLRSKSPSGKCAKLQTVAASNNRDHMLQSLYYCLFVPHTYGCYSSHTSHSWWITHSMQPQRRGCNNIPSFLQQTTPITRSFCEVCTWHDLHILITAPLFYERKARMASAESFTLWQQVTTEITQRDHSHRYHQEVQSTVHQDHKHCQKSLTKITLLLLVRTTYIWVLLFAHILFMVNCTFNATSTERLQQYVVNSAIYLIANWVILCQATQPCHH